MDFRCNQSRGLHFIYVIPFSKKKALIESTLFSKNVEDRKFYLSAINSYLKDNFNTNFFKENVSKPLNKFSKRIVDLKDDSSKAVSKVSRKISYFKEDSSRSFSLITLNKRNLFNLVLSFIFFSL